MFLKYEYITLLYDLEFFKKLSFFDNIFDINLGNTESTSKGEQNELLNQKRKREEIKTKSDKEIILLITNNNKDKKNINEQYKNQIEILKKEVEERKNMNEQYKNQITNLQKKIFQMQNSDNEYDKD